ncbi:MAG: hypothetical protein JRN68_00995 [Nitrososphaerota archaeon]|nr:hypothetical protein [Nitrososphaerota archaeon]
MQSRYAKRNGRINRAQSQIQRPTAEAVAAKYAAQHTRPLKGADDPKRLILGEIGKTPDWPAGTHACNHPRRGNGG